MMGLLTYSYLTVCMCRVAVRVRYIIILVSN